KLWPPLIEDWISDSEDEAESNSKIEMETVKPSLAKIKFVKSKEKVKSLRKTTVKQVEKLRILVFSKQDDEQFESVDTLELELIEELAMSAKLVRPSSAWSL
nr:hypothetical protein [Tanacetum cinerariifolium]